MTSRFARALFAFLFVLLILSSPAFAQEDKDYRYTKWDVDVTVNKNSTLDVVETITQKFDGDFTGSYRDIYYGDNVLSFSDVSVSENGVPYNQGVVIRGSVNNPGLFSATDYKYSNPPYVEILYSFSALNEEKTFVVSYKVNGGFYYYDKTDQMEWKAIAEIRDKPIDDVTVTVHLPEDITLKEDQIGLNASGRDLTKKQISQKTLRFTGTDFGPNTRFWVGVEFPKGYITVNPELLANQKEFEARRAKERIGLIVSLGISILLVVFVFLLMLVIWWKWGKDVQLPQVAEYLTEPPDATPPAVVSEILDEDTDIKDINATLVDMARRGYIKFWKKPDDTLFEWLGDKGDLKAFELQVVNDLFAGRQTASLSSFKNTFYSKIPQLKKMIGQESVNMGFYKTAPAVIKRRFLIFGLCVILFGGFLACVSINVIADLFMGSTGLARNIILFSLPVATAISGLIIIIFGFPMTRKTKKGAEANARWAAFKVYLENIQKYGKTGNAQEIYERFMPYAVAFKLERIFTTAFAREDILPPVWFAPYWYPGYPDRGWAETAWASEHPGQAMPTGDPSSGPLGDFDLNTMNDSLVSTLNEAATVFTSVPESKSGGGGFSGGGGGFSGGGGGGGGSGSW